MPTILVVASASPKSAVLDLHLPKAGQGLPEAHATVRVPVVVAAYLWGERGTAELLRDLFTAARSVTPPA